jgi:hypothetical protein
LQLHGQTTRFQPEPREFIPNREITSPGRFKPDRLLDLDAVLVENERQLNIARDCYEKYLTVLKIAVAEIRYIPEERE